VTALLFLLTCIVPFLPFQFAEDFDLKVQGKGWKNNKNACGWLGPQTLPPRFTAKVQQPSKQTPSTPKCDHCFQI
jgi:hypothetical protein